MSARLTRRGLLALIPGALALILPGTAPGRGPGSRARSSSARSSSARCLSNLFEDTEAASRVGRAYLDAVPEERSVARLLARLDPPHTADLEALRSWAAAAVRHDFERADTIELEGWLLARTEVRLCALCGLVTTLPTRV